MNKKINILPLVIGIFANHDVLTHVDAATGIDVSEYTSTDSWSCMSGYGYSFSIARGYLSYGAVDTNGISTLENAKSAGIEYRDFYMFPCRGLGASDQMTEFIEYLQDNSYYSGEDYQYIWLDLESNPKTSCYWSSYSATSNCDYVKELISTAESYNVKVGIYSSYYNWELIFDSVSNCNDLTDYPLWYAHYDDLASFSDWDSLSFGGWDTPSMKQYVGDDSLCSTGIDKNYAEQSFFDDYYSDTTGTNGGSDCTDPQTAGGVSVSFESGSLTSYESCDSDYDDPNDMGVYLFSESEVGTSTYVSNNFQVAEFVSPDGADGFRLSPLLVECLQAVREDLSELIYIKQGYRTVSYNSDVGGASSSYHLSGTAAEIYGGTSSVLAVSDSVICNCWDLFVDNNYNIGLGLGDDFMHVDVRPSYGYWVETGASKTSDEWNTYINSVYSSCSTGDANTGNTDTGGGTTYTDEDDSENDDGTIAFPNANLSPITYTSSKYDDPNDSGTYLFSVSDAGSSTYLSDNFQVGEFDCNDGSDGFRLTPKLVECLQAVRNDLGISINVNSGYRTTAYNSQIGGATYSRHQSGTAADIQQYSVDIYTFADSIICNCRSIFLRNGQEIGLGLGGSYLHVDMRPYFSYWIYSDASMSSSSWGSYITDTYSQCNANGYNVIQNGDTATYDDVNEAQTDNDIDHEENIEGLEDSSDGSGGSSDSWIDDNWWIILVIGIVILIGGIIAGGVLYMRNQKQQQNSTPTGYVQM